MSLQTDASGLSTTRNAREYICDRCLKIDFGRALAVPAATLRSSDKKIVLDTNIERFRNSAITGCRLCRLLSSTICENPEYWSDPRVQDQAQSTPLRDFELRACSYLIHCVWAPVDGGNESVVKLSDYHVLVCIARDSWGSGRSAFSRKGPGESGYVVCLPPNASLNNGLYGPRTVPKEFDYRRARSWITDCIENHGAECHGKSEPVPGMMLIDTDTLDIVLAKPHMKWASLSYVWGPQSSKSRPVQKLSPGLQRSMPKRLPSDISAVIRDAIVVTKQMGLKYLWIDRYCINQNDAAEKASQICMMDLVYRGAEFTIIGAAGEDENYGLPGVGSRERTNQEFLKLDSCTIMTTTPDPIDVVAKSRWWKRGWTFQEGLLSRRRLIFTEYQVFFECNNISWMEAVGGLEHLETHETTIDRPGDRTPALFRRLVPGVGYNKPRGLWNLDDEEATYVHCFKALEAYTRRDLTFDSDSLNGILGTLRFLQKIDGSLVAIGGLPYRIPSEPEDPNLVNKRLFFSLCWFHSDRPDIRRRPEFPSWTWAGWAGPVRWMGFHAVSERGYHSYMQDIQIVLKDGRHLSTVQHSLNGTPVNWLEDVAAFRFRAQIVPSSLFLFNIRKWYEGKTGMENEERYYTSYSGQSTRTSSENGEGDDIGRGDIGEGQMQEQTGDRLITIPEPWADVSSLDIHGPPGISNDGNYDGDEEDAVTSEKDADSQCSSVAGHDYSLDQEEDGELEYLNGAHKKKHLEDDDSLMDDWNRWTVGKHRFYHKMTRLGFTPREFLSRLDDGSLGCILLGDCSGNAGYTKRRFMLVVEWKGRETAVRVGALVISRHYYVDVQYNDFFDTTGLPWKSVELV